MTTSGGTDSDRQLLERLPALPVAARRSEAEALARTWTRRGVRRADPLLSHADVVVRRAAFAVLCQRLSEGRGSRTLGGRLSWGLLDGDPRIRRQCAEALGSVQARWRFLPDTDTLRRLVAALTPEVAGFLTPLCQQSWRAAGMTRAALAGRQDEPALRLRRCCDALLGIRPAEGCAICAAIPALILVRQFDPDGIPRAAAALVPSLPAERVGCLSACCPDCGARYTYTRQSVWDSGPSEEETLAREDG